MPKRLAPSRPSGAAPRSWNFAPKTALAEVNAGGPRSPVRVRMPGTLRGARAAAEGKEPRAATKPPPVDANRKKSCGGEAADVRSNGSGAERRGTSCRPAKRTAAAQRVRSNDWLDCQATNARKRLAPRRPSGAATRSRNVAPKTGVCRSQRRLSLRSPVSRARRLARCARNSNRCRRQGADERRRSHRRLDAKKEKR